MQQLSGPTKKIIEQFSKARKDSGKREGAVSIHVDEVALRVAAFYEKVRTVVEWKEEHLMRRAAIIRKLKRRFFDLELNNFQGDLPARAGEMAEGLVLELIRGGHFPNDEIEESKIKDVQNLISKYIFIIKNKPENQEAIIGSSFYNWLIDVAACEVEDALAPAIKEKALIEYMLVSMKERIKVSEKIFEKNLLKKGEEDIQIYIAVCQALFKLDKPIISYNLLKYKHPNWNSTDQLQLLGISKNIFESWKEIESNFTNPISNKFYAVCERYDTPYLLIGDILNSENSNQINKEIEDPALMEGKIKNAYSFRMASLNKRISRAAIYSTISIFATKIISLVILEWIIDMMTKSQANPGIFVADVAIPTALMFLMVVSIKKPSKKNINLVIIETMKIIYKNESPDEYEIKLNRKKSFGMKVILSLAYVFSAFVTFGFIIFALAELGFPATSIVIDIIFIALILFAGTAVAKRAQELTMEPEKEGFLSFLADIFFLPIQVLGKWLSNTWKQYNAVAAFFNALIDMPFTAFVEFIEGWRYFIKERKEEIR